MPLELRPMAKEDAQEAVALTVSSYKNNAFRAIVLPTGMSQVSIDHLVEEHQKAVDDPDKYILKVVDTDNNDMMAGCAVWQYTKARSDADWDREREEGPSPLPEARLDIRNEFVVKEQIIQRRIMGHTRWLGEAISDLHTRYMSAQLVYWSTADELFNRTVCSEYIASLSTPRSWINAGKVGNRQN